MKDKLMGTLENFAKAVVQPLMYLSAAGMLMVIGVLLTNSSITALLPFLKWAPLQFLGEMIYDGVMAVVNNLAVVFAIGLPAAFAKGDKHRAALIGFMSYFIFLTTSHTLLELTGKLAESSAMLGLTGTGQTTTLGIQCVDMSVFGGLILGCITGYVFNRTYKKRFDGALQIYSGANFSFICMFFVSIVYGILCNTLWPFAQSGISALANVIKSAGTLGLFIYGFLERFLVPTGLHHLVYTPFMFTDLGGTLTVGDTTVAGAYAIVLTEMQLPVERFSSSIYYMATGFTKMFGYIGIGLAFIKTAYPENKKRIRATMIPLIITASLGAVTEPIDFMFCFAAPVLWVINAAMAGLFIVLLKVLDVTAFCGGNLLASFLMNISAGVSKTHWPVMFLLGLLEIALDFAIFTFLIQKFNFHTPGREGDPLPADGVSATSSASAPAALDFDPAKDEEPARKVEGDTDVMNLINGLGGKANIAALENCITRLRVNLNDPSLLDEELINKTGNSGIVKRGNDVQIVYGLQVADVKRAVEERLETL